MASVARPVRVDVTRRPNTNVSRVIVSIPSFSDLGGVEFSSSRSVYGVVFQSAELVCICAPVRGSFICVNQGGRDVNITGTGCDRGSAKDIACVFESRDSFSTKNERVQPLIAGKRIFVYSFWARKIGSG